MKKTSAYIIAALMLLLTLPLASCDGDVCSVNLVLFPPKPDYTIKVGETGRIRYSIAEMNYDYVSEPRDVKYGSGNRAIATVDQNGLVTGVSPGVVTIHAGAQCTVKRNRKNAEENLSLYATIQITVLSSAKIADVNVFPAESAEPSITFSGDYTGTKDGKWSIDDPTIASIATDGHITGLKPGSTAAHFDQNGAVVSFRVTVECPFQLTPASIDAVAGIPQIAGVAYNSRYHGDTHGTWISSDPSLVYVDANGVVTGIKNTAGSAVLTYTVAGVSGTVPVTVRPLFTVPPDSVVADIGKKAQLTVSFDPAYTGDTAGTWAAADKTIASISQDGVVKGVKAGTTMATFTHTATGLQAALEITVPTEPAPVVTHKPKPKPTPTPAPIPTPAPTPSPIISGPDSIILPLAYTSGNQATYAVTGSSEALTYGITNISSHPEFFNFDGMHLSITSGLGSVNSPYTLTLTAANAGGTVVATKIVTVYLISIDLASIGIDEGTTEQETVYVYGAGPSGTYTLSIQDAPTWVTLSGDTLNAAPPAGTVTSGSSQDFTFYIVVTVPGDQSATIPFTITVNVAT